MTSYICIMFWLLCCCLLTVVVAVDCPYKECDCDDDDHIDCSLKNLTSIPHLTGSSGHQTVLNLQSNNITEIPAGYLPPNLTEINFSANPITVIDIYAFNESQNTLQTLTFSGALFTRIPDSFIHLTALNSLVISDTFIRDWNEDVLKIIGLTLESLHLINVTLHVWPTWIQYFSHLTEINFQSNYLSDIPDNALDMLNNSLFILVLNRNNFTVVPKAISPMNSLETLDLGYNKISNLTWLPQSKQLGDLSLMYNKLGNARHISDLLRPLASSVANVDLFGNQLTEIPDLSFMENIGYLSLTNNHISDPLSGSLSGEVTDLDLDFNLLPAIPVMFLKLPHIDTISLSNNLVTQFRATDIPVWIEEVDLDYNLLTELTDTSFPEGSKLNTLNLMGNPLVTISNLAFQNLKHITNLNLQGSKITRLPLGLKTLKDLRFIDITNCQDLVCTCLEKSLATWLLSMELPIEGNCGETSIYNFFNTFIQYCPN